MKRQRPIIARPSVRASSFGWFATLLLLLTTAEAATYKTVATVEHDYVSATTPVRYACRVELMQSKWSGDASVMVAAVSHNNIYHLWEEEDKGLILLGGPAQQLLLSRDGAITPTSEMFDGSEQQNILSRHVGGDAQLSLTLDLSHPYMSMMLVVDSQNVFGVDSFRPIHDDSNTWYDEFVADSDALLVHEDDKTLVGSSTTVTSMARWTCKRGSISEEGRSSANLGPKKSSLRKQAPSLLMHEQSTDGSSHALLGEIEDAERRPSKEEISSAVSVRITFSVALVISWLTLVAVG